MFRTCGFNSRGNHCATGERLKGVPTEREKKRPFTIQEPKKHIKKSVSSRLDRKREYDPEKDIWQTEHEKLGVIEDKISAPVTWAEKNKFYQQREQHYRDIIIESVRTDTYAMKIANPDTPIFTNQFKDLLNIKKETYKQIFRRNSQVAGLPLAKNDLEAEKNDPNYMFNRTVLQSPNS